MKLLIDFESRSRADLPAVGQHLYARHPSTEVMCLGWKIIGEGEAKVLTMPGVYTDDPSETKEFKYAVKHAEFVVAHNAPFEQAMWKHCLLPTTTLGASLPYLPPEKWLCTLSMASILALPRSLENAGNALNLKIKKDVEARKLLLKMCKPRKPIQNIKAWIEWVETDDALKRLYEYCRTDIVTEELLFEELTKYRIFTKKERELWVLDQKINQRGFYIDKPMVGNILRLIEQEEKELSLELQRKTFYQVATVKQTKAFRDFLLTQGFDIPNLQKGTVDATIEQLEKENNPANSEVLDILKIRQSLGMSSTSKYQAFLNRVDDDGRVRDNILFHGASTGRFSGQGVQPQNFPRGRVKMTKELFEDIAQGDLHLLRLLYGRPMDLFSSALRGVIRATPGFDLYCGDFNAIEARVLLWLAGETKGLKEYEDGVDAYRSMASVIYQIPIEKIDEDQRFLGKSVILGCFGPDTLVLTSNGAKKIIDVTNKDLLWDGTEWVSHEGLLYQGQKEVIDLEGVFVTPDHLILKDNQWVPALELKENPLSLKSALASANLPSELSNTAKEGGSQILKSLALVRPNIITRFIRRIFQEDSQLDATLVQKKPQYILEKTTRPTLLSFPTTLIAKDSSTEYPLLSEDVKIKNQKNTTIMGEGVFGFLSLGSKIEKNFLNILSLLRGGIRPNLKLIGSTITKDMNLKIYALLIGRKMSKTEEPSEICKKKSTPLKNILTVFDIVNAGPRSRFTILTNRGPLIVHNCGYQMGKKKFAETVKASGRDLAESIIERAHAAFREKYPLVPKLWSNYENAAIYAVQNKGKRIKINRVSWYVEKDFLFAELPSGRRLAYYKPQIRNEETPWGELRPKLYVWTTDSKTKQWVQRAVYGGLLTENISQAVSRDCMAEAMFRTEDAGYRILITVHDELLNEKETGTGSLQEFTALMSARPEWAPDLPLKVGSWTGKQYKK